MSAFALDLGSLAAKPGPSGPLLALDFGTAYSKAAVVFDRQGAQITALSLSMVPGVRDYATQPNPYVLASSLYVDGDRFVFGPEAYAKGQVNDNGRRRFDSPKSLFNREDLAQLRTTVVPQSVVPWPHRFTEYELALLFLGYLTAVTGAAAKAEGLPSPMLRRFAVPGWTAERARFYAGMLANMLAAAQILSDSFGDRWFKGIGLDDARAALNAVAATPLLPMQLIDQGVHEATAAGACVFNRRWKRPRIFCVVDVGAGTVDVAAFLVFKHLLQPFQPFRVAQIRNTTMGYDKAGDALDDALMAMAFAQAGFAAGDPMRTRRLPAMRRQVRELKEALFRPPHAVDVEIAPDIVETITRDAFLSDPTVIEIVAGVRKVFRASVEAIGSAPFEQHGRLLEVYLTGGGARLPFIMALTDEAFQVNGKKLTLERFVDAPEWMRETNAPWLGYFSQLAVALGATRPDLPEGAGPYSPAALSWKAQGKNGLLNTAAQRQSA